jgi:hypothetical protein
MRKEREFSEFAENHIVYNVPIEKYHEAEEALSEIKRDTITELVSIYKNDTMDYVSMGNLCFNALLKQLNGIEEQLLKLNNSSSPLLAKYSKLNNMETQIPQEKEKNRNKMISEPCIR